MGILAIAWPLDVYQRVPLASTLSITNAAAAALIVLWVIDLATHRRPRLPFELCWPPVLMATMAVFVQTSTMLQAVSLAALFFATVHFARDRIDIERLLTWSARACALTAAFELASRIGGGAPTAYALPQHLEDNARLFGATSATSGTLINGATTLLTGLFLWIAIAVRARFRTRAHFGVSLLCLGMVAGVFTLCALGLVLHNQWQPSAWIPDSSARWILGGLTIWLLARVGARIWVEHERTPDGHYLIAAAPAIALAVALCFVRFEAMAWHVWATGLAASYVIRDKKPMLTSMKKGYSVIALIAITPFLFANVLFVDQTREYHGRLYERELRADYAAGDRPRLEQRLDYWDDRIGRRTVQAIWRARLALDDGRPEWASAWTVNLFKGSAERSSSWPMPTPEDRQALLDRLRDYVSAMPKADRSLTYERALAASGDADAAEASLRQRIAGTNPVYEEIDRAPLQHAAEFLVEGGIRSGFDLSDWSAAELLALFDLVGAHVEPAPDDVDRSWLPATVAVRRDGVGFAVYVESLTSQYRSFSGPLIAASTQPGTWADDPWQTAALPFDASWQIALHTHSDAAAPIVTVTLDTEGEANVLIATPPPQSLPDQSVVFIWLP